MAELYCPPATLTAPAAKPYFSVALLEYPKEDEASPSVVFLYPKEEAITPNALFCTPTALEYLPVEMFMTPIALEEAPESKSTHLYPGLSKSYVLFKEPTATLPYPLALFSVPKAAE